MYRYSLRRATRPSCIRAAPIAVDTRVALTSTRYHFPIELSQVDRGAYESLDLRVARHPSETERSLCARVLAFCLYYQDGLEFSKDGIASKDEPALSVRNPAATASGYELWVDVGTPSAERLHKASKASRRVVVVTHHDPRLLQDSLRGQRVHRVHEIEVVALASAFLDALVARIGDRGTKLGVTVTDGTLYVDVRGETLECAVERVALEPPA